MNMFAFLLHVQTSLKIKGSTVQELIKGCQDHDTIQHSLNSFVAVACLVLWLPAVSGNITAPKPCAFKDSQDMWHAVAEKLNHPWHAS